MKNISKIVLITLLITSCTTWTKKDAMRLFAEQMDDSVMRKENINGFLNPHSAVKLLNVKEIKPDILEYSFVDKHAKWFLPSNEKCRFILVVDKKSGNIIDWKYNGKKEYCTSNP